MITSEIHSAIQKSVLCWLATSSQTGEPNVSPKEIFVAYGDQYLLIANIMSPQSTKNIRINRQVAVSFVDVLVQKGFQLKGTAEIIDKQHDMYPELHAPLYAISGEHFPIASIIKISVASVKPILAPRYVLFPNTTEAEQIEAAKKMYNV